MTKSAKKFLPESIGQRNTAFRKCGSQDQFGSIVKPGHCEDWIIISDALPSPDQEPADFLQESLFSFVRSDSRKKRYEKFQPAFFISDMNHRAAPFDGFNKISGFFLAEKDKGIDTGIMPNIQSLGDEYAPRVLLYQ